MEDLLRNWNIERHCTAWKMEEAYSKQRPVCHNAVEMHVGAIAFADDYRDDCDVRRLVGAQYSVISAEHRITADW